jgi:hypothetical protein
MLNLNLLEKSLAITTPLHIIWKHKIILMKKGFVFSLDAIIVLGIVLTMTFFLAALSFTYTSPELRYQRLYYSGKDLLNVIEQVRLQSLSDNPAVRDYQARGIFTQDDMNKTVLDAIGSFWAEGNITEADNLTESVFSQILNGTSFDYQLLIDGQTIHEKNTTAANFLSRLSLIVSGYDIGKPVSGFSARTRLLKVNRIASSYVYFGGYVGDGNISVNFTLPEFDSIINASMELNSGANFTLYINGNSAGTYNKNAAGNISADKWVIGSVYYQYLLEGENSIWINFSSSRSMFIGGGYIKITYNTSKLADSDETYGSNATKSESMPGINGIINLYSSFYTPGSLKNLTVRLHYSSNFTVFMTIGNITVYEGNSSVTGEKTEILNSTYLSGLLNYSSLSNRTIPFRVGLQNVSYLTIGVYGIGDPVLVTDVSGSMDDCAINDPPYINPIKCTYNCLSGGSRSCTLANSSLCTGNPCLGGGCINPWNHHSCSTKLTVAKDADKNFVAIILNESTPGNRVGLVNYSGTTYSNGVRGYLNLTANKTLLNNSINSYGINQNTCICCGIIRATNMLGNLSDSSRRRIEVVMTDGEANVRCNNALSNLDGLDGRDAKDDTIQAACDAYSNLGIIVYTVGFGANESEVDNLTLNLTAQCGHGKYYFSNATDLARTFQQIALEVINASYVAQTVEVLGSQNITYLFPDSNIKMDYASAIQPAGYGEVMLTLESPPMSNMSGPLNITDVPTQTKEGWYYVPSNMQVVDSKITSYSSNFWTDRLYVNSSAISGWTRIYWLGDYGINYTSLGDPFVLNIPVQYIASGNNSVRIGTGMNTLNGTGGSGDNRIIYTLKIGGISFEEYSSVFPKAKGSTVTVYYDSNGDNVYDGYTQVQVGPDPSDIFDPENDSVDDSFMRLMDGLNFLGDLSPGSYGNGTAQNPYDGVDLSNPIDLQITSDVEFDTVTASGIPSLWGPAIMEIRIWT